MKQETKISNALIVLLIEQASRRTKVIIGALQKLGLPNTACTGRWGFVAVYKHFLASSLYCSQAESTPTPAPCVREPLGGQPKGVSYMPVPYWEIICICWMVFLIYWKIRSIRRHPSKRKVAFTFTVTNNILLFLGLLLVLFVLF